MLETTVSGFPRVGTVGLRMGFWRERGTSLTPPAAPLKGGPWLPEIQKCDNVWKGERESRVNSCPFETST